MPAGSGWDEAVPAESLANRAVRYATGGYTHDSTESPGRFVPFDAREATSQLYILPRLEVGTLSPSAMQYIYARQVRECPVRDRRLTAAPFDECVQT